MPTGFSIVGVSPPVIAFDLVVDGHRVAREAGDFGTRLVIDLMTFALEVEPGEPAQLRFEVGTADTGVMREVEIWLPQSAATELRALRVADASRVEPPTHSKRIWAHYGSSISHCIEAHGPTEIWPAVAARLGDVELRQFAFAGQCHLDQFVARSIAAQELDLISLKLGINVVNADSLTERTFPTAVHGFLDTLRDRHPETPILVISPIICPMAEDHPGPTIPDGHGAYRIVPGGPPELRALSLTLQRIRTILSEVVAVRREAGDNDLHYLDGLELFGEAEAPTLPDGLHPDGDGYVRIGRRFAAHAFAPSGPFAP
jgi:lysophospholipase L1-like esterase